MTEEQANSLAGAVSMIGKAAIAALPAQFLLLCLINVLFLGILMWFIDDQLNQRTQLANRVMDACIAHELGPPPQPSARP